jgi:hypothetical protein
MSVKKTEEISVEKGCIARRVKWDSWEVSRSDGSFVAKFSGDSGLEGLDEFPCEVASRPGVAEVGIRMTGMMLVTNERRER